MQLCLEKFDGIGSQKDVIRSAISALRLNLKLNKGKVGIEHDLNSKK